MYAVVQAGGKQYRVSPGDVMIVNRLSGESGDRIDLSNVLMLDDGKKLQVGSPFIEKTAIQAEILEQKRDKKIIVFKKKRRKGYRRKHGHRQHLTVLRVLDFADSNVVAGLKTAAKAEKKAAEPSAAKATAKKAPATATKKAPKTTATAKDTKAKKAVAPKKASAAAKPKPAPKPAPKAKKAKEE